MKCPKCGYLGFETVDRCRNCGYDFSLAPALPSSSELPLNQAKGGPWADFELAAKPAASPPVTPGADARLGTSLAYPRADAVLGTQAATPSALDLDRLIGAAPDTADQVAAGAHLVPDGPAASQFAGRVETQGPLQRVAQPGRPANEEDEPPLTARPRPVGPPLVVRRTTPEIPRGRPRGGRPPRREERPLLLEPEVSDHVPEAPVALPPHAAPAATVWDPAPRAARLVAAAIDLLLLGGINAVVLYLTLGIAGLTVAEWWMLPPIPMASFLLLLNAGYLTAFTAAGGRTIGKMATSIRVIGCDGQAIDASGAVLRAVGGIITVLALGLPYLPALLAADGRPLADRLAGTRVVRSA